MTGTLIAHLVSLRKHSQWADRRFVEALQALPEPPRDVLRELAHVRGAQEVWLSRIEKRAPVMPVWPALSLDDLASAGAVLDEQYRALCDRLDTAGLATVHSYTNTAGLQFETRLDDILVHVFMHGQYHRGKANVALRAAKADPVSVDYVAYLRSAEGRAADPRFVVNRCEPIRPRQAT